MGCWLHCALGVVGLEAKFGVRRQSWREAGRRESFRSMSTTGTALYICMVLKEFLVC